MDKQIGYIDYHDRLWNYDDKTGDWKHGSYLLTRYDGQWNLLYFDNETGTYRKKTWISVMEAMNNLPCISFPS